MADIADMADVAGRVAAMAVGAADPEPMVEAGAADPEPLVVDIGGSQ